MSQSFDQSPLTQEKFLEAITDLSLRDKDLAAVIRKWGEPPFWIHEPGFPGIVLAILSQQVSLESAQAAFFKLESAIGVVSPQNFLTLDDGKLREVGFSRQKASYVKGIARSSLSGDLDFEIFHRLDDDQVREQLLQVRGIGKWTADTYLLFGMRRPDVWPSGDLALVRSIQEVKGLVAVPGFDEMDEIAEIWRPWRAVAARILWHSYLCERGR